MQTCFTMESRHSTKNAEAFVKVIGLCFKRGKCNIQTNLFNTSKKFQRFKPGSFFIADGQTPAGVINSGIIIGETSNVFQIRPRSPHVPTA